MPTGQTVKLLTAHPDMTYQEIGEIVGCSRQRVHAVATRAGLTKKSRFFRPDITVEKVVELYYGSNLLVQDMARIFGCHLNTITKRLRAAGVSRNECYSRRQKLYWRRVRQAERKEGVEMETKTMTQPLDKTDKEQWAKVQIYTPTHICAGHVYCPGQRRLLDLLNGLPLRAPTDADEFLAVSEVEIRSPDGEKVTAQSAHINKANVLFLKEIGDEHRGLGGEVGHKVYPYVAKSTTKAVKLYMPLYTLTGQMHCAERRRVVDVLNSEVRFLALTNVEICSSAGSSESGVSFIAVNKGQILSLEELGVPLMGVRAGSQFSE